MVVELGYITMKIVSLVLLKANVHIYCAAGRATFKIELQPILLECPIVNLGHEEFSHDGSKIDCAGVNFSRFAIY